MSTKTRTEHYHDAFRNPSHADVVARCHDLDIGDGIIGEVVAIAIVDLGEDATVSEIENEVREGLAEYSARCRS